jgi:alpha-acetolactate decarboxylase
MDQPNLIVLGEIKNIIPVIAAEMINGKIIGMWTGLTTKTNRYVLKSFTHEK